MHLSDEARVASCSTSPAPSRYLANNYIFERVFRSKRVMLLATGGAGPVPPVLGGLPALQLLKLENNDPRGKWNSGGHCCGNAANLESTNGIFYIRPGLPLKLRRTSFSIIGEACIFSLPMLVAFNARMYFPEKSSTL